MARRTMTMLRITAAHFVAGLDLDAAGWVTVAPPIVKYMLGWHKTRVANYCDKKFWMCEEIEV